MLLIVKVVVMCRYPLVQKKKKKFRQQNLSEKIVAKKDLLIICVKTFGTRWCSHIFWRKNLRESIFNFLSKMLLGETLCKFIQIFPPKVFVYISTNFFLMENYLTDYRIKRQNTYYLLIVWNNLRRKIKITQEHCWVYLITTIYKYE